MLEVGDCTLDGIGELLGRHIEPQSYGILAYALWVVDNALRGYRVELQFYNFGVLGAEIEHRLVACGALLSTQRLAHKAAIHKHTEVGLRLGRGVVAQRVEPDGETGHTAGVAYRVEEANLVYRGLILHIAVGVLEGVDTVIDRLEVLRDEDAVLLGTRDNRRLILKHRRVPLLRLLDRVGREEEDKRLAYRVGLIRIGSVARHIHRVNLLARREYIAHRVQGVALVVVENRRAEVDGIGGVRLQGILDSHNDATATPDDRGFLLHRRRGKELLLLVLNLHILVKFDVNLRWAQRIYLGGEVIGVHQDDYGRYGIFRATRGCHCRGTLGE